MINVFATLRIKPGMLAQALACYRSFVPKVLANEPGCIEYAPTVNLDLGLPNQDKNGDLIFVCERWKSADDFRAHLTMAHSAEFRSSIKDCLAGRITIRITQAAI